MELVLHPPLSAPLLGGDLIALFRAIRALVTRERLTPEEQQLVAHVEAASRTFGGYVLEATEHEDLLARVDSVLEDRASFHAMGELFSVAMPLLLEGEPPSEADTPIDSFSEALGGAAAPHLLVAWRCAAENQRLFPMLDRLFALKDAARARLAVEDPLDFLSDPRIPVPVARGMLAGLRQGVLWLAICTAALKEAPVARWLGLALAAQCAEEARLSLALLASMLDADVPEDLVPPSLRLDLPALFERSQAVAKAYQRFNAEAVRSGEPIYPPAPLD